MRLLVIIPAYNEEASIKRVISDLKENYPQYDYVVVNDGSRDNTAAICRDEGYELIDLPFNLGLSGAVRAGMRYALRHQYDAVLQLDGDGQHRPEFIEEMLRTAGTSGADIVIGSRFFDRKKGRSMRMMGSRLISFIIYITTGYKISDPTSGMRLYSRSVLKEFVNDMNFGPEPDTISLLLKRGATVKEVQVEMNERMAGESYLNPIRSIRYMINMSFSILFVQFFRGGTK